MKIDKAFFGLVTVYFFAAIFSVSDADLIYSANDINVIYLGFKLPVELFFILPSAILFVLYRLLHAKIYLKEVGKKFKSQRKLNSGNVFEKFLEYFPLITSWFISFRAADYQDKTIFAICLAFSFSMSIHYIKFTKLGVLKKLVVFFIFVKTIIVVDVIYMGEKSIILFLHKNTNVLYTSKNRENVNWFIPHLHIDRRDFLWRGQKNKNYEIFTGVFGSPIIDKSIEILDLRGRSLKYLQIPFQSLGKVWAHDADFTGANFYLAQFLQSAFERTNLTAAWLELTDFSGSSFYDTKFIDIGVWHVNFQGTYLNRVEFIDVFIGKSYFFNTLFNSVNFKNSDIKSSVLDGAKFNYVSFKNSRANENTKTIGIQKVVFDSPFGQVVNEMLSIKNIVDRYCNNENSASDRSAIKMMKEVDINFNFESYRHEIIDSMEGNKDCANFLKIYK